jgi:hypothetical protein
LHIEGYFSATRKIGFANKLGRRYIPDGDNQKQMLLRMCKPAGETLQEKLSAFRFFSRLGAAAGRTIRYVGAA